MVAQRSFYDMSHVRAVRDIFVEKGNFASTTPFIIIMPLLFKAVWALQTLGSYCVTQNNSFK